VHRRRVFFFAYFVVGRLVEVSKAIITSRGMEETEEVFSFIEQRLRELFELRRYGLWTPLGVRVCLTRLEQNRYQEALNFFQYMVCIANQVQKSKLETVLRRLAREATIPNNTQANRDTFLCLSECFKCLNILDAMVTLVHSE